MKSIDYYMGLPYRLEIIPDPGGGGYIARYPELPGCVSAGKTLETAAGNAVGAKRAWLEAAVKAGKRLLNRPRSMIIRDSSS